MELKGKSIIVTGAGGGIGAEIAAYMATRGASVLVNDVDEARCTQVAMTIVAQGGQASSCQADVTKSKEFQGLVDKAMSAFGRLDAVVNNAGWTHMSKPMLDVAEEEFDKVFAVNVKSIYLSAIHAAPAMQRGGGGSFIHIASIAGVRWSSGLAWYSASKAAVIAASKAIAGELGPLNIRSNCINPGFNPDTGLADRFTGGAMDDGRRDSALSRIPLRRFCSPQDIASAAAFLASDEGRFINGACINVDGGRSI
jgi:3-oxoacyl-[acyl-carrier protein] reductase